jgi:hypothetical protein
MPKYTITTEDVYEVEADTLEQAMASYHVGFQGIEPEVLDIKADEIIDPDFFEYLGGQVRAEENA